MDYCLNQIGMQNNMAVYSKKLAARTDAQRFGSTKTKTIMNASDYRCYQLRKAGLLGSAIEIYTMLS